MTTNIELPPDFKDQGQMPSKCPFAELTNLQLIAQIIACCKRSQQAEHLIIAQPYSEAATHIAEILERRLRNGNVTDRQILADIGREFAGRADG